MELNSIGPEPKFLAVTREAGKWKDLSRQESNKETIQRIASVGAGLIFLIGTLVVTGFIIAANPVMIKPLSPLEWSWVISMVVFFSASGLCLGHGMTSDKEKSLYGSMFDLLDKTQTVSGERGRLERIREVVETNKQNGAEILTEGDFDQVYARFRGDKPCGGLGPMVRSGILTVEQGNTLRGYLEQWGEAQRTSNQSEKDQLKEAWATLQSQIKNQLYPEND